MSTDRVVTFRKSIVGEIEVSIQDALRSASMAELVAELHRRRRESRQAEDEDFVMAQNALNEIQPEAEAAYYAMKRGDTKAVEEFICECAGRVA